MTFARLNAVAITANTGTINQIGIQKVMFPLL